MTKTALRFSGVGLVKKKERGTLDNGTPWRVYEVAFDECRRRFKLTEGTFEAAPMEGEFVEITGRIETDAKAEDVWVLEKVALAGGAAGDTALSEPKRKGVFAA